MTRPRWMLPLLVGVATLLVQISPPRTSRTRYGSALRPGSSGSAAGSGIFTPGCSPGSRHRPGEARWRIEGSRASRGGTDDDWQARR